MVDIMLVLLIIFMVVTPFLQQGITVALPKNMNNPDIDPNIIKESSVVISIPNDGEYYLAKKRLQKEQLAEKNQERLLGFVKDVANPFYAAIGPDGSVLATTSGAMPSGVFADFLKSALAKHQGESKVAQLAR